MSKVIFLSGAGLSAESGIRTFRDFGGLWHEYDVMDVCSVQGFKRNRQLVLDFYDARRADLADKEPNAAHKMIADLQKEFPDHIVNLTQNVDNLLEKAGCTEVIHLHGELTKIVCEQCGRITDIGYQSIKEHPQCVNCGCKKQRHFVVMFGEEAPHYRTLYQSLADAAMLIVIGTSGQVLPVDEYAKYVRYAVLNNLEPHPEIRTEDFNKVIYAKATEAAPQIAEIVRQFLGNR